MKLFVPALRGTCLQRTIRSAFVDIQAQQRDGISFDGRMVIE